MHYPDSTAQTWDLGYLGTYSSDRQLKLDLLLNAPARRLADHRFVAIVTHRQNLGVETGDFIEESNVWTALVAQPLLCQYKPALTLAYSNIQILVPRAKPCPIYPPTLDGP